MSVRLLWLLAPWDMSQAAALFWIGQKDAEEWYRQFGENLAVA
jgi:hypothetical protein